MMRSELARNLYVKLVMAGRAGRGIRLTAEECWSLATDDPIVTAALGVADDAGFDISLQGTLREIPSKA